MAPIDNLVRQRASYQKKIVRVQTQVRNIDPATVTQNELELIDIELKDLKEKIDENFESVSMIVTDAVFTADHDPEYDTIFAALRTMTLKVMDLVKANPVSTRPTSFKLERVKLPKFSGNFDEWQEFHDLFESAVHKNGALSGAEKMVYLKSSLSGQAEAIVTSFPSSSASYKEAYDSLVKRYDNKREIVFAHIRKLDELKPVQESTQGLRKVADTINECVRSLKILTVPVDTWDVILVYLGMKKLDPISKKEWLLTQDTNLPELENFMDFIETRATALADVNPSKSKQHSSSSPDGKKSAYAHHISSHSPPACPKCNESHRLFKCPTFRGLAVEERKQIVKSNNLCFNCLFPGHSASKCASESTCKSCGRKHHTMIHSNPKSEKRPAASQSSSIPATSSPSESSSTDDSITSSHCTSFAPHGKLVLLGTMLVTVVSSNGKRLTCRVFLDPGSERNLISENCVDRLNLPKKKASIGIAGISGLKAEPATGVVNLAIHSMVNNYSLNISALVLRKITGDLPSVKCSDKWPHLLKFDLADPTFHNPGPVDILLGAEHAVRILLPGIIHGHSGAPSAQNSQFGWILSGPVDIDSGTRQIQVNLCTNDNSLESSLTKFWSLEEPCSTEPNYSKADEECETHFRSTFKRSSDGRYTVQLPFKQSSELLGQSRDQAVKRFLSIEGKLTKNHQIKQCYIDTIHDYIHSGIIRHVPNGSSVNSSSYYMPHHYVLKPSSQTTKVRVVFDASAKSSTGFSLNDLLHTGPKLQTDLNELLIRFCSHLVCMSADIEKFYYQFKVADEHVNFLRFLWRDEPSQPLRDFRFTRVTFGVKSGPYLAIRSLHQLADDERIHFPKVCDVIKKDFLVDNLLSGASTVPEALEIQRDILEVLNRGRLKLRQWTSNCSEILDPIQNDLRQSDPSLPIQEDESIKTIGILWYPSSDTFGISISTPVCKGTATKRQILSAIAKIFDPLGWLSPITIKHKILIQQLWKQKLDWDELLPLDIVNLWEKYIRELPLLNSFRIPRCVTGHISNLQHDSKSTFELHGFSDGSNSAFSACVYIKAENEVGGVMVNLVTAKSKVAPVKGDTTPRLELCGALLLTKLIQTVIKSVTIAFNSINCWSDSTCVLGWLASEEKLDVFVHNRVRKIRNCLPRAQWRHVSGDENPADPASRGISVSDFISHPLWLHGPQWLATTAFPSDHGISHATRNAESNAIASLIERHSSYSKIIRIVAYALRFITNSQVIAEARYHGSLAASELENSLKKIVFSIQGDFFQEEIQCLLKQKSPKSKLKALAPFIDPEGILRVGGRLLHSRVPYEQKHPMLLPSTHSFTTAIIRHFHLMNAHAGPTLLIALIRQTFWILSGPRTIKSTLRKCVPCFKYRPSSTAQIMGELPFSRVNPSRPFSQVGVDYAGPFTVCIIPGRKPKYEKSYVAVFVCMATKAAHLERVGDLSTPSFIASLNRFVSRRGLPDDLYCDQGTNFVGANTEFKEFSKFITSKAHNSKVFDFLADKGVNFHFNPPLSPHHGGLWEAVVKSMKFHFHRVTQSHILSIEEFSTLLCEVEACLNSRPITQLSSDPSDFEALTPGHFLIGQAMKAIPCHDLTDVKQNRLTRWQLTQQIQQHFWKRWSSEYLHLLQSRPKWSTSYPNLETGVLVLLHDSDSNLGPCKWRLGRVTKTFPGKDGKTRVCDIITSYGSTYRRPISKISVLPIYNN